MRALRLSLFSLIAMACCGATALGHPGHGPVDEGWLHWVTSPVHLVQLAIPVALALLAASWMSRRLRARRPV